MKKLVILTGLGLIAFGASALPRSAAQAGKPNIIVIVADDLGYGDLGVHGCKDIPTPNIDSIARNGVRCTNGYVSGPYCSPTRAALMTGRYQQRFGHEFNPGPPTDATKHIGLTLKEKTLAAHLKAAGYRTGMVGKWHLGHADEFNPVNRGFEEYFGFLGGSHPYFPRLVPNNPIVRGAATVEEPEYLTDAFAREALAYVDRHAKEPFFLYLSFNAVHGPLQASEKYLSRFPPIVDEKRRTYAGMLVAMDEAIGAVLAKLRSSGLEDDTLIFFISDNGGPENVNASDNGAFNGQKATTWEGGIHVPFFIQWKKRLPAGDTYDLPVIQMDIFATALAAAGVTVQSDWKLDGVNLLPYLKGDHTGRPHEALFWRFGPQMAIRAGDWKLVRPREPGMPLRRMTETLPAPKLFNLKEDIGETTDVSAANPEVVKRLTAAWERWNAELMAPEWGARVSQ